MPNAAAKSHRRTAPERRVLLKDRAYLELKELIQTGVFPPHSSVSERQLVKRLGMSKTPIRSALENLEAQGLVSVSPQKGVLIKELSAREISELFDVRNAVEPFIVGHLARRTIGKKQIDQLKANLKKQSAAAKKEDAVAATQLDIEFHQLLATILDNHEMIAWLEKCFDKLQRSVLRINSLVAGRLSKSTQDHKEIVEAVVQGDESLAAQRMLSHLRYGRQFLLGIE